jgi:multidrug resistance efflux pump
MFKTFAFTLCSGLIAGAIVLVDRQSVDFATSPAGRHATLTPAADQTSIFATGIVEGRTEEIELLPEATGRVDELLVGLGDWVDAGQVLLKLDNRTQRAQVAVSLANLQLEQANLDRLVNGARESERAEARALLTAKQARLRQALLTWQRVQTLRAQDALSQQEADDQEGVFHTLSAEVEACQARLNQLEAPARDDELRAAQARVAAAQAAYELSQIALDRTVLRAPVRAQVIDMHVEIGETVSRGRSAPVVVLSDTSTLRVRAFVEEIDAPSISVGAKAIVAADGLPNQRFEAIVASVSPRMNPKRMATDRPNELYDSKMREVVLDLTVPPHGCALLVGLRVDVTFTTTPPIDTATAGGFTTTGSLQR